MLEREHVVGRGGWAERRLTKISTVFERRLRQRHATIPLDSMSLASSFLRKHHTRIRHASQGHVERISALAQEDRQTRCIFRFGSSRN